MQTTLKVLNDSFQSLTRLAQQKLPKDKPKLIYKLSRIYRSAKDEISVVEDMLEKLRQAHDLNEKSTAVEISEFNRAAAEMLASMPVTVWGDPFEQDEILGVVDILPFDLGELSYWLINLKEDEKAAAAAG